MAVYNKQTWVNGPEGGTPLDATRLQHIEDGIVAVDTTGGAVTSVAGKTGTVSLVKGDVGLGNVDNTADAAKPVSTAQAAANATATANAQATSLQKASNLNDVPSPSAARTNLGLGNVDNTSDANKPVSTAQAAANALALTKASNLSDLASASTARSNLGLGTAATQPTSAFDTSGAASALALSNVATIATANGALTIGVHNPVDASGGARTMTLANAATPGQVVSVEKTDSSANTVAVTLNLRGTPSSTLTLYWQNESIELRSKADGSWWPTAGHKTKASIDAEILALGNGTFAPAPLKPSGDATGETDVAAIQALLTAANAAGGGLVTFAAGTFYVNGPLTIYSNTKLVGAGRASTIVKLANSSNTDLLVSNGFAGLTGGNTSGGVSLVGLFDLTLDGNKTNNASGGVGFKHYGAMLTMERVTVRNCKGDGVYSEWSNSAIVTDGVEGHVTACTIHDNGGNGVTWAGPHDSDWHSVIAFSNGGHGVHVKLAAAVFVANACHVWGTTHDYGWYLEAPSHLIGCQAEGASVAQVFVGVGNCEILGGRYFAAGANTNVKGVVIGDNTTHTSIAGTRVLTYISGCLSGAIDWTNSAGNGFIFVNVNQASGAAVVGSTKTNEFAQVNVTGGATGSVFSMPQQVQISGGGANAFLVVGSSSKFNVNATSSRVELVNACDLISYSDSFTTKTFSVIGASGHIVSGGAAPTVAAQGSAGTGATASVSGNDTAGVITLTTGTGPATGAQVVLTFASAFTATPKTVRFQSETAAGVTAGAYVSQKNTTTFGLGFTTAPAASTVYTINYEVLG